MEWKPIESAPKDREIILAGQWALSGNWDVKVGQYLATRWPFVGERQPSHWMPLPPPPTPEPPQQSPCP